MKKNQSVSVPISSSIPVDSSLSQVFSQQDNVSSLFMNEGQVEFKHSNEVAIDHFSLEANPQNDWLLSLNKEERKGITGIQKRIGLQVKDQIPELGIVRVSVLDYNKALPILKEFSKDEKLGFNFPLRQPVPPRKEVTSDVAEFSNSFIEWMGGNARRDEFGNGVKIALLDSGVDSSHPLLNGVVIRQKDFLPKLQDSTSRKVNAHGTAIASVVSSRASSYSGIAPGSEILSYRVIDELGKTDSFTVASAIVSAVQDGADVINLSLGGEHGSEVLKQAVHYALENGVPLVASVGNEGVGLVNYPAAYDGVIGVTSLSPNGRVTSFSNFGQGVDLAAPGSGVLTAWESSEMVHFSGTSISAAMVTGAIAVELARTPSLSPLEIDRLLRNSCIEAERPGFDSISGYGALSLSRLENQNNPNYCDPALVGYHFEHSDGLNAGTLPFDVMIQNQGNTWVGNLSLHVNYLAMNKSFRIDNLAPGELRMEKLYLQGAEFDDTVEIEARLVLPSGMNDARLDNNKRKSVIKF